MSKWPDKVVIGLTGNIATGKSVVRKMLEYLGAFGIDADGLTHRAMAKTGPAYDPIVQTFGRFVLGADGQIDRRRLGSIVFNDPDALRQLEAIVHPFVQEAIELLIQRASQPVIIIEAIKLLEGGLADECDAIWVVDAPAAMQQKRLMRKRKLSAEDARLRIDAQAPQAEKVAHATLVIRNGGTFEETWAQVQQAWSQLAPPGERAAPVEAPSHDEAVAVERGKAADAATIAAFINATRTSKRPLTRAAVIASFGEKAYFMARADGHLVAVIGWQIENLVTRVDELHVAADVPPDTVVAPLTRAVEQASTDLQSEAALMFIAPEMYGRTGATLRALGYAEVDPEQIAITAWRDAARESRPAGTTTLIKRLREDRVLRPV